MIKRVIYSLVASILAVSLIASTARALTYDRIFYENNNIIHYNPLDVPCSESVTVMTSGNVDYAGNQVLNSAQLTAIQENQSIYESAATAAGIPWQLLAAVHYRETGLKKYGPANGDGPFQIVGNDYPVADPYTNEQFQIAANDAAVFIKNKAGDRDLSDVNNIKYTLFAYNGTASSLKQQAKSLGFSDEEANNGEGSPYVMNRADIVRDPTVEPTLSNKTWGQIKTDGGSISYPANSDYGAFVIYAILSNIAVGGGGACSSGGLISGGMNLEQAQAFMDTYKNSSDSINYIGTAYQGCSGGPLANCVSFSAYFVNKYTNLEVFKGAGNNVGNGSEVVNNMASRNSSITTSKVPSVYSVFSTGLGATECGEGLCGHTGVVLGIDTAAGKIIIGEASCGNSWIKATEFDLAKYTDTSYTYAHIGSFVNIGGS